MAGRTFATGDIHGDLDALLRVEAQWPKLDEGDTLVFVGDYVDRGPQSAQVVEHIRSLSERTPAQVVALRGNHEDGWLRVVDQGWPEFVLPEGHGCRETMESYLGSIDGPLDTQLQRVLMSGAFLPLDVLQWFRKLPLHYEDEHAIYVHAGLPMEDGEFPHPSDVSIPAALLWHRDMAFFRSYRGKRVVFGHTVTEYLPEELSSYTPEDPTDMWAGPCTIGLDTGCGKGGFLTTLEMPSMTVYESR
ncbi:MAG: serine/threonine protein phosphatase [Deltaproteobacteria bacterium]|jgi:serine/threonine protein phosphatase 1|nr:serine/threonine protein phosphatase [Deltaproteobacteria bacterium]MBW2537901.1 serine/threonine protein phosphatase [Deltaproteobacteria bacterium]